jgi:ribosomal-protein-alanine N-acetyltransferase
MKSRFDKVALIAGLMRRLPRRAVTLSPASLADAPALAALHAAAFRRGWSAEEFERLLIEPNVVGDRAMAGELAGFVLSRIGADQSEILSLAVAAIVRRRGLAGKLMDVHLRRLAGYGVNTVFLEVDERNLPARRLYAGVGFREVGRRPNYYAEAGEPSGAALIMRRDRS